MSIEEELKEHAEHAMLPFDKKVAGTMAIIAAALAVVSVLGHLETTEELVAQQRASDQWSFSQGKSIRRYQSETTRDVMAALNTDASRAMAQSYAKNVARYQKDSDDIRDKAREFEKESHLANNRALRLHVGEVFLEIAIVFASLAILTKRSPLWWTAILGALIGVSVACTTVLIHS